MNRKLVSILAGLIAVSMTCTSCGNTTTAQEPDESSTATDSGEQTETGGVSGEITVWTSCLSQATIDSYISNYNSINENVKVNGVVFPGDTFVSKLQASLRSGSGAPDVAALEIKQFGNFKDSDFFENLSQEPYNVGEEEVNMIPYVAELCKDSTGNFKGLSFQSCPGGFWYNKKLALEYLGTDNPDELSNMWTSWEDMPAISQSVYEKSDGAVYLFDSIGAVSEILLASRSDAYVTDSKLYDLSFFKEQMQQAKEIRDAHGDAMVDTWSAAWANGFYENQNFIMLCLPSWGLQYAVKVNTPEDAPDTEDSWGFCQAPNPYESGGTWFAMYAGSEQKDAAWDFVKTASIGEEYLINYVNETGDMVGYIPAIEKIIESDFRDPFTGDQEIYRYEYEAAKEILPIAMTKYDQAIQDSFINKLNLVLNGEMDIDSAINAFKEDLTTQFPEMIID